MEFFWMIAAGVAATALFLYLDLVNRIEGIESDIMREQGKFANFVHTLGYKRLSNGYFARRVGRPRKVK